MRAIAKRLSEFLGWDTRDSDKQPSRILVTASTSGSVLSKPGKWPFSITLKARLEPDAPITIDAFVTLLEPRSREALYYSETGKLAGCPTINFQYEPWVGPIPVNAERIVEIPFVCHGANAWTVSHAFGSREKKNGPFVMVLQRAKDPAGHFIEGHGYGIGLGDNMSTVRGWKKGGKWKVFARESLADSQPPLPLVKTNTVTFEVVA